jgi:hypothetical protein
MVMQAEKDRQTGLTERVRLRFGHVSYAGLAFAPAEHTYRGIGPRAKLTTVEDSGRTTLIRGEIAKLYPLAAAALYEVAFAREAGPLDTWMN